MSRREGYLLRPIEDKDLERVLAWRNSERIRASMYTDHTITMDEHRGWFERTRKESPPPFMVFEVQGKPVGGVNISHMDRRNGTCHWGFYIGEETVPRGSGKIMGLLGLEYIFDVVGIRKLIGEAFAFNEASIAFHRKLGFLEEGHFVKHVLKNGTYEDIISFALFRDDWLRLKGVLEENCFGKRDIQ